MDIKGHNFTKMKGELQFLFSAYHLMMLYILPSLLKVSLMVLKFKSGHEYHANSNGDYSGKIQIELRFLRPAYCLIMAHICT